MTDTESAHSGLHSEHGGRRDEHPGRSRNPVIRVDDIAWLEFEKPDLVRAEVFARAFGFQTVLRTADELQLRGTATETVSVIVRRGARSRFLGAAYRAVDEVDLRRLATRTGAALRQLADSIGGMAVDLVDPNGIPVHVVSGMHTLPPLPFQEPLLINSGHQISRVNAAQRPPRAAAQVQRLGHLVLQTTRFHEALDWYLDTLGMIVSDFQFFPGQRDRGPAMSFIRCDRGSVPADHHTLAMALGPAVRYMHSAYQVCDLDALAAGGEHLLEQGYFRSWGIGRHVEGSQLFDYWRDPDGFLVEHFADGDMFDNTLEPGWSEFTASGLRQWGAPPSRDFLGISPGMVGGEIRHILDALRTTNEFDLNRLYGLMKVARS